MQTFTIPNEGYIVFPESTSLSLAEKAWLEDSPDLGAAFWALRCGGRFLKTGTPEARYLERLEGSPSSWPFTSQLKCLVPPFRAALKLANTDPEMACHFSISKSDPTKILVRACSLAGLTQAVELLVEAGSGEIEVVKVSTLR